MNHRVSGKYTTDRNSDENLIHNLVNPRFRTFDGSLVKQFGKYTTTEPDGFASRCNPMNVFCQGDEILTAESSVGHIQRFSTDGELIAYIDMAPIGGG